MHARLKFLVLPPAVLASLALSACSALTPVAGRYPSITPQEAQTAATSTQVLRWGGTIIGSSKVSGETCLTVLSYPLDRLGKPQIGGDIGDSGRLSPVPPQRWIPSATAKGARSRSSGISAAYVSR
ncbi:MAG: Slp family lipoprotein [Acidithiobacillus sp.]|uniref:Slp family lipoprotein n=1 Tax=Acidithiobacillus sp. TaxID=1872118 RepID=UPI003D00E785